MKRLLPIFLLVFAFFTFFTLFLAPLPTYADDTPTPTPEGALGVGEIPPGNWQPDPDVTFVGKMGARSGEFLDWALREYKWATDEGVPGLRDFWVVILKIAYSISFLTVLVSAFIMIVTRGRSVTVMRFVPRFIFVMLLIALSFSVIQFLYQVVDIFQGAFLKNPAGNQISHSDLLDVAFHYQTFVGYRDLGATAADTSRESAFISLLLVKLTAVTYYVMVGLLILRKIILWFFLVISPIFPLLWLYYPLRNTAKIWLGEFFRWLLYAPIFAIFLSGLVSLWTKVIPQNFNYTGVNDPSSIVYPTAVNIVLGGPGQPAGPTNSINLPDTFALYVFALVMLWVVTFLPFLLLQIFLSQFQNIALSENSFVRKFMTRGSTLFNNTPGPQPSPVPPPFHGSGGMAKQLPYANKIAIPQATYKEVRESREKFVNTTNRETSEVLKLTNLSVPTMRDIARFETQTISSSTSQNSEVTRMHETLQKIGNPTLANASHDQSHYSEMRSKLILEKQKGNPMATTVLSAASIMSNTSHAATSVVNNSTIQSSLQKIANPMSITNSTERQEYVTMRDKLVAAKAQGNPLATTILENAEHTKDTTKIVDTKTVLEQIQKAKEQSDPLYGSITNMLNQSTTSTLSENTVQAAISNIANATQLTNIQEKEKFTKLTETLSQARTQGNPLATTILENVENTKDTTKTVDTKTILEQITLAKEQGDPVAVIVLEALGQKEQHVAAAPVAPAGFPVVNRVQTVSLDDYEAVKKMWTENYQKLEPPVYRSGVVKERKVWIAEDIEKIEQIINLLSTNDLQRQKEAMSMVSNILPFLLIGGFSQTEIIAYLKAKLEAAKQVEQTLAAKDEEEETLMDTKKQAEKNEQHLEASKELPQNEETALGPIPVVDEVQKNEQNR